MNRLIKFALATLISVLSTTLSADIREVDSLMLEQLRTQGVAVIDVRRPDEWAKTGVVEGSHPLTFFDKQGKYDAAAWLEKLNTIVKRDQPFVLICARGVRSSKIASLLDKRLGYTQVHNATHGINQWIVEKRPVVPANP